MMMSLHFSNLIYLGNINFLLTPVFLRGVFASAHLVLLIVLSVYCVYNRVTNKPVNSLEVNKHSRFFCYRSTLFSSLVLSIFYLLLCVLKYFFWRRNRWSDGDVAIQLDLVLRTLAWVVIFAYLYAHFSNSRESKFPLILRIWWGFFFLFSCSLLVIDLVLHSNHRFLPIHLWSLDVISAVAGLFFLYAALFGKREEGESLLEQPLLNSGSSNVLDEFEKSRGGQNVTPFANANLFSILTFSWLSPMFAVGYKKTIDLDDVPQLYHKDSVKSVYPIIKNKLDSYCNNGGVTNFKLVKALFFSLWREILLTAFLALTYNLASYVGPYLIDTFVQFLNGQREFRNEGYVLVSAFIFAKLAECLSQRHWYFRLQQVGIRARGTLVAMIYKKSQSLSSQAKQSHTTGEIINYMAVDAERIGDFSWYMHDAWLIPIQVSLALSILYKNIGLASIAALVATIIVMLINVPLGKLLEKFQEKLMDCKDERMKKTSEILRNMRILKLQAWEMKFLSKVIELRKNEEGWLKKYVYSNAVTTFIFWGAPTFVAVVSFVSCMVMGIPLESGKILSALATFRILQEPIYVLPDLISMAVQTKVSLDRIKSFLNLNDLDPDVIEYVPRGTSEFAVEIHVGNFSWDSSSSNPALRDLNVQVRRGMRVAVCGTVGSGKSSLLASILGEVPKVSGSVKLSGTKAYVAQSPWIQSGKIEENILFGKEMDRDRYEMVLEACALKKDLEIFSFGDQTVIGERGINLSGGQKQRVQIARALYQEADIYLFDDPFSAVDAHTGAHLFKKCLLGLLASKTIIYVTHQVEFLPSADLILVMKDGRIVQSGMYHEILNSGTEFMELVRAHKTALSAIDDKPRPSSENFVRVGNDKKTGEEDEREGTNGKTDEIVVPKAQIVQEEEREKGKVNFQVYWKYLTMAYGGALVPLILLAQVLFQLLEIASNYWMAWGTPVSKDMKPPVEGSTLIVVYVELAIGSSIFVLLRALLLVTAGYKTATLLFNKMHFCIFHAPMSFFDATPSGRILNRASTDQSAVDLNIPVLIEKFAFTVIQVLGVVAVMSQVAWQIFVVFIPVIVACIFYEQYYIATARELSRLLGVNKAPLIQHFSESISGSSTIRSFDQESRFMDTNLKLMDNYSQSKFHNAGALQWLCFRLDMLSSIVFTFSLVFLISMPTGVINPGFAGLAVTYGLNLNTLLLMTMWSICNVENKMISVERILQYTCIPSEPPLVIEANRPDQDWPSDGKVDIHDLQVRYAPHMPLVLRGLTCSFPGGMKTGIVGRTGSGKSTLIQTLFRIIEPTAGHIIIDGINISTIGLHELRSRLSIIPQDPTMFEGSVRSNLDPLEEYSDEQIWEALDRCQLGDEVRRKEGKLDAAVAENGENWSVGQRQLVCLGRVLLKRSKFLVLDEATASVDTATDNLIQQTLREQFSNCTVITIAHRISSVLDSDFVALLDDGLLLEYDTPTKLLDNKSSLFSKLDLPIWNGLAGDGNDRVEDGVKGRKLALECQKLVMVSCLLVRGTEEEMPNDFLDISSSNS
ncbi:hypothetical protein Sjap_025052 [Stephania japonica]|uniref:ABC transporter C family member 3 n=1 Tax=Stephania japonica TaxID=461633 RepID=A0AAP0E140_9MAGN